MLEQGQLRNLIQGLNSRNENTRRESIQSLKQVEAADWASATNDIVKPLVENLRHHLPKNQDAGAKAPLFRQEIATILGNIGHRSEPAIPQLMELLEDGIPDGVREAAAGALGKIGKESRVAIDQLIQVLQSTSRIALADRIARALGDIGCADQRVRTALVNLWLVPIHSHSNQVQVAIALCKLRIDARGLLKYLTATLVSSRDTSLRKSAAEALAWCSKTDIDVVPALSAAMHDEDEDVRKLAAEGLAHLKISPEKAIRLSAQQLKDSVHAEAALRKNGAQSVQALMEALESNEPLAREKAARTLGSIGEAAIDAAPVLQKVLKDKHLEVRLAAAKALWNISKNADAVVPVLADMLAGKVIPESDNVDARRMFLQSIIESLCRIGPPAKAAVPALTRKTKDDNRLIRESAQRALREIGAGTPAVKAVAR